MILRRVRVLVAAASVLVLQLPSLALAQGSGEAGSSKVQSTELRSSPAELLLGSTEKTSLLLDLGGGQIADMQFLTSTGEVGEIQDLGYGRFSASYLPPEELFPQVAIVAVIATVDAEPVVGWVVIPLVGQGEISVPGTAGEPVMVKVGKKTFGPETADEDGSATIRIQVPPGYESANAGDEEIPLGVAPFSRILIVPLMLAVEADGKSSVPLRIFAVSKRGEPLKGARLQLKTKRGEVSETQEIAPGVYEARYTPPRNKRMKSAKVTVALRGDRESKGKAVFKFLPPAVRGIALTLEPSTLPVASTGPVTVLVEVTDGGGEPIDGEPEVEADLGELGQLKRVALGRYQAELTLADLGPEQTAIEVSARINNGSGRPIDARAMLTLGEDGAAVAEAGADAAGEPKSAGGEGEDSSGGETAAGAELAGGETGAPAGDDTGADTGADAVAEVTPQPETSSPFMLVGLHGGFQTNFRSLYAPMGSLDLTLLGDALVPGTSLQLGLDGLYQGGETRLDSGPLAGRSFDHTLAAGTLNLIAGYRFAVVESAALFFGVGVLGDYIFTAVEAEQQHSLSWGGLAQAGLAWTLGPGELVFKARYSYGGLQGEIGGVSLFGGYALQVL